MRSLYVLSWQLRQFISYYMVHPNSVSYGMVLKDRLCSMRCSFEHRWTFPTFLRNLVCTISHSVRANQNMTLCSKQRREGADKNTVIRLTKFHELNVCFSSIQPQTSGVLTGIDTKTLRVIFRFLFVVPLVTLGFDGVKPHPHVNENM